MKNDRPDMKNDRQIPVFYEHLAYAALVFSFKLKFS
jgi:hypothetical protein